MLPDTAGSFVLIRTAIGFLRGIAPASLSYTALCAYRFSRGHHLSRLSKIIGIYALLEALFYLLVYLPRRRMLQKPAVHPPRMTKEERSALFSKCRETILDENYPARWFLAPGMKKDNVRDWLLWGLFSATRDTLEPGWNEELDEYVGHIETVMGAPLQEGYNPAARAFRTTMDPVVCQHRPLLWYTTIAGLDSAMAAGMTGMGFKHYADPTWFQSFPPRPWTTLSRRSAAKGLSYWYRPHRSTTKTPILFIHGIGIGLFIYLPFFKQLVQQDPDVGILAVEILPICNRITSPPLEARETCDALGVILDDLKVPRVVVISHSYGTVVTAHLFRNSDFLPRISATIFVDPIPFCLHLPAVAYNFVYRVPTGANQWQTHYFASRDPDISRALSRHLFWTESILWKEDIAGKRVTVVLGGDDQIVGAEHVRQYLTDQKDMKESWTSGDGNLSVLFYPGLDHAVVFDKEETIRPVLDVAHKYVAGVAL